MRYRHWIPLISVVILLYASSSCSSYELPPVEKYIPNANIMYYDIRGSTAEDLVDQMNLIGPMGDHGRRVWAYAQSNFSWDYSPNEDENGNCRVENAQVGLKIDVKFPRWIPPNNASPELIGEWENFIRALAEHENGHVKLFFERSGDIEAALWGSDCGSADGATYNAFGLMQQINDEYDDKTNHGATQGAIFPSIARGPVSAIKPS